MSVKSGLAFFIIMPDKETPVSVNNNRIRFWEYCRDNWESRVEKIDSKIAELEREREDIIEKGRAAPEKLKPLYELKKTLDEQAKLLENPAVQKLLKKTRSLNDL